MRPDADVLIAGGGLAAQRTAETLRRAGYEGRIRVLCEERHAPYDRPPLSKGMLSGERETQTPSLRPPAWHTEHDVELLLGTRAYALDPLLRSVLLADGSRLRYEHLVIATGSRPRRLPSLPLGDFVRELRTIEDARALRRMLVRGVDRLAIVGAGLIGMEVASVARSLGVEVTLIEAAPAPLARAMPAALGIWLAEMHRRAGVGVVLERAVDHVAQHGGEIELTLSDRHTVNADLVLVATGTVPATEWLAGSGLRPGAILVDTAGRAEIPGIHAAGDAACYPDPISGRHTPTPHWEAAALQGATVARTILGVASPVPAPPMFWSDQHGVRIQFVGHAEPADRLVFDGDRERRDFTAWLMAGERAVGAMLVGRPRALPEVRRRISGDNGHAVEMSTAA